MSRGRICDITRSVFPVHATKTYGGSIAIAPLIFYLGSRCESSFRSHYGPRVDSASNRNKYQEYFLGVKAVGA
jgi:hypothetical protein